MKVYKYTKSVSQRLEFIIQRHLAKQENWKLSQQAVYYANILSR